MIMEDRVLKFSKGFIQKTIVKFENYITSWKEEVR
jgi:hypothetical protein